MSETTVLIWYRNDLRTDDHPPIAAALAGGSRVVPLYCFDPRQFRATSPGVPKTGPFRARFLIESVADLRRSLRALGCDLVVRVGLPEAVIPALVERTGARAVYCSTEVTREERDVDAAVQQALAPGGAVSRSFAGATLYHPEALPFPIAELPELFTDFRKRVEADAVVAPPRDAPTRLPALPEGIEPGELPCLEDLGLEPRARDPRAGIVFEGGERAALARLDQYVWQGEHLKTYKQTRNGMLRADDSSKLSPWLAHGCLSPRRVYAQVRAYEAERVRNESTYWLIFELLWRDFFRFVAEKHGDRLFRRSGLRGLELPWRRDGEPFEAWCRGVTGVPLVDANMRELAATGFMSNRGRQNVASFLTKNLGIDWRMGAEWFESLLVDYDVASNWGNWCYAAGVGNDARGFRYFNLLKQSADYDASGEYVKHWLPELGAVPAGKVHAPWGLLSVEQQRFGVRLGVDYPWPIVDLVRSVEENERSYAAAEGKARGERGKRRGAVRNA